MSSFSKYFVVVLSLGSASLASGSSEDRTLALNLEKALPTLVSSQDYRSASTTAFRLASARSGLGERAAACAALSQSLEHYRSALVNETGAPEAAASGIYDDSDGMAEVRAKFGCKQS